MEKSLLAPEILLNSGHKMPSLALGTATYPMPTPHQLTSILIDAIAAGYRHIDTAASYGTEETVGQAVAAAVERGLIGSRNEVFVTSKLSTKDTHRDLVLPALKETLRKLGMDYVDLYLVHWPIRIKQSADPFNLREEDMLEFDAKGVWEGMEECCRLGLVKSIGVSNFSCAKLSKLLEFASIPPAVNQVEMNVGWQQQKMLEYCKEKRIHVCAWSPLAANGAIWGSLAVMDSPILKEIAAAKNKTIAQVALRWIHEQGGTPIVKSFNKERMKQNLQIFDWELTVDELCKIQKVPQAKGFRGERFVFPEGQYKSLEQLWDGEI
ncbi:methylecgonone reductase-like [Sesamum indicum]|uniref:Methylecgonone reductase-like n=1 Tax=Sesamum indicum TaxID=4182 RepID=A0A6I9SS17_SESIN|nr:methylecgonone reductase-like [Sesamum indicum]